nr:hypothetical protein [Pseudomonas sp. CG7]
MILEASLPQQRNTEHAAISDSNSARADRESRRKGKIFELLEFMTSDLPDINLPEVKFLATQNP